MELEGERAEEHPRRCTRIRVSHLANAEDIPQGSLERAITIPHKKYRSVAATLDSKIETDAIRK